MRITSSDIQLSSTQINEEHYSTYESLHLWDKTSDLSVKSLTEDGTETQEELNTKKDDLKLSIDPVALQNLINSKPRSINEIINYNNQQFKAIDHDLKTIIIKSIIEAFTGEKVDTFDPSDIDKSDQKKLTN